jgi:CarD family transcriptional regulator
MKAKYKIGTPVVHLSHGAGIVKGIDEREFSPGKKHKFYLIEIEDNGAPKTVFVPLEASVQRLRPIMSNKQALEVVAILKGPAPEAVDHQTWNRRYREYMEEIHTGDPKKVARVAALLIALRNTKDLSFGERKLLDQALRMLERELAFTDHPAVLIAL